LQTFDSLGLDPRITKALTELSIVQPTQIQSEAIPILLNEAIDFLGLAQTGTGKTAAFGIPLIEHIDPAIRAVQAIVLSPTRELAQQIEQQLTRFAKYIDNVSVSVVYGGAPITVQIKEIQRKRPQVIVATPGRMIDLIDRKVLNLSNVRFAVLDEADEMLNMGFKEDIDTILSFTQHDKNIWLFSATMPSEIRSIVHKYMVDPVEVTVQSQSRVNENISHEYALVRRNDKQMALQRIMDATGEMYCVVFCRTKAETQRLATSMADAGYPMDALHGDMSQAQRNSVMRKFKAGQLKMLAATDVAARGIDVDNLTHVVHFDLPDDLSFYTHRSGRTARAGKKGVAISMVSPAEEYKIRNLERQLHISFKKIKVPTLEEVKARNIQNRLDDLLAVETSDEARIWVHGMSEQLSFLSKEEVLAKFVTRILEQVSLDEVGDLNAPDKPERGKSGDKRKKDGKVEKSGDRKKGKRGESGREEGMQTFEINLGKGDRLEKGDLLKIICDATGVRSKHIGKIFMFKSGAKFDVAQDKSKGVTAAFQGLRFKGRSIKVTEV
jgi:ATP-dependent RNA helicase DeaD